LVAQTARAAQSGNTSAEASDKTTALPAFLNSESSRLRSPVRGKAAFATAVVVVAALGWWRWQQGWTELEAKVSATAAVVRMPRLQVPAELMQRRITHEVAPEYPQSARRAGVQGTVVLAAVVNGEGAVTQVKVISGPPALSLAALEAVRWWRYEPYLVNGQPITVETKVALNFRLAN
jgi:TonB family protein